MASNAAQQTATFGIFQHFFATGWGGYILPAPWGLAPHWTVILPLLLFSAAIYRHALVTHRFFVQQMRLEEEGAHLADRAGHGLGLAMVARCATLMGAQHGLQSRLGRSSCFWLSLPRDAHEAEGYLVLHKPVETDALQALPVAWMEPATEEA